MKISEMILVSDLDGTLLPASGKISDVDLAAIQKFRDLGGIFTVATGRAPLHADYLCKILGVDSKVICNNGACIFDMKKGETVWSQIIDKTYIDVVKYVLDKYPQVGIQAISDTDGFYVLSESSLLRREILTLTDEHIFATLDEVPLNIIKVLFLIEGDDFDEVTDDILAQDFLKFEFVKSGGACFEMMHSGTTKGSPLGHLARLYNRGMEQIAAIGDYYNDIDMLKKAGISAAIGTAPDEVKSAANMIVGSCEDNGVADFIEHLISQAN